MVTTWEREDLHSQGPTLPATRRRCSLQTACVAVTAVDSRRVRSVERDAVVLAPAHRAHRACPSRSLREEVLEKPSAAEPETGQRGQICEQAPRRGARDRQ